jgi:hypothetical protein
MRSATPGLSATPKVERGFYSTAIANELQLTTHMPGHR